MIKVIKNKFLSNIGIILIAVFLICSLTGFAQYKYTQQSGLGFFVSEADKADALEDTNEVRQILDDLGYLLGHTKRDGLYPADKTTGGSLTVFNNYYTKTDIDALTTDDIDEGSLNLYFTNQRAKDAVATEGYLKNITGESIGDLSDVGDSTATAGNVLVADGDSWESRALTEADISDLGTTTAMVADKLSVFASTTSAELAGVISDETGSGALVFGTSPKITNVKSDGYLNSDTNTFFGIDIAGAGNLTHTTGSEGWCNTFVGYAAGYSNNTGYANTFNGYYAGYSNNTGTLNTFNGYYAGYSNNTGYANTFNGVFAGISNTTGNNNTFNGYQAGRYQADGSTDRTTGDYGLYLGTETKASANGTSNEIVIGYNAIGKGSNTIKMGNTSITAAHIQVSWTVDSDIRAKTNIEPLTYGLDFVKELEPIQYQFKTRREEEVIRDEDGKVTEILPVDETPYGKIRYGFSAQDVLAIEEKYSEDAHIVNDKDPDHLGIVYDEFIPILVNAIQEQQALIDKLQAKVDDLEARILILEKEE